MTSQSLTGACFCGEVSYEYRGALTEARSCHCSRCRKVFSGQASAYAVVEADAFQWAKGESLLTDYDSGGGFGFRFCSRCGSLLCGVYQGKVHGVTLGCLNEDPGIEIEQHIFVGSKASWERMPEGVPCYKEGPDSEPWQP